MMARHGFSSSTSDAPAQKIVIKPFKVTPKIPENYEKNTWERLKATIRAIHGSLRVEDSFEELYKIVENQCHYKMSERLFHKLRVELETHAKSVGLSLERESLIEQGFLERLDNVWRSYCDQLSKIRCVFLYLDRTYVIQSTGLHSLWDLGLSLFRENVMQNPIVKTKTQDALIKAIDEERVGSIVFRSLLRSLIKMYKVLGIYINGFERPFISYTHFYYQTMASKYCSTTLTGDAVASYLKQVEEWIHQETDRCHGQRGYLDPDTHRELIDVIYTECVRKYYETLAAGAKELLEKERMEDIHRIYHMFGQLSTSNGLNALKNEFSEFVKDQGWQIVGDAARDNEMITSLLEFKEKLNQMLQNALGQSDLFVNAMREAFESFVNKRPNKPAELLAKHIDSLLKTGKGSSESEIEKILDACLGLFRFLRGKDVFEAFYKKDLAKRLLLGKSSNWDTEKHVLTKLKTECGAEFTSKLEGMFKDIDVSRDIMASFKENPKYTSLLKNIDLYVNVLTTGIWPTYLPMNVTLPEEMSVALESFKEFYMSKHNGRHLDWQHSLSQCVVKAQFKKGNKELSVSAFQALVLLLFNDTDSLTYQEIEQATGIESSELKRTLQSLALGKARVLNKTPRSKDVNDDDRFEFNELFEHSLFRIKINAIQLKETVEEAQKTNEKVAIDRQYLVDAAIVRIMKARKRMSHSALVNELYQQLKFSIKTTDLKKRIESLIEREYMDRDKMDPAAYIYLA